MYAIFEDGSRQYRVSVGDRVWIDYREKEVADGETRPYEVGERVAELGRVLLYANGEAVEIGKPVVEGARVVTELVRPASTKTYIQHFRRRKNSKRLKGHRQPFLDVKVTHILAAGEATPPEEEKPTPESPAE